MKTKRLLPAILITILFLVTTSLSAQVSKTITNVAGGLAAAITTTEKSTVTNLTVQGSIDSVDFITMNAMPVLAVLDISGVSIVRNNVPNSAFTNKSSLKSVVLPGSVKSIGTFAFSECFNLTSINLPNSVVSIGNFAFTECSKLTSIAIPASVSKIGYAAFFTCGGLITVESGNQNFSSLDGILFNKNQTELITCPISKTGDYTIPNTVYSISYNAFCNCNFLTSITIPKSVNIVKDWAFGNCTGLTAISIPASVTSIGIHSFGICGLISVDAENPFYCSLVGVLFNKAKTELISCSTINTGAYEIPATVTSIRDYAFYYCKTLTSITLPNSVASLGNYAFQYCKVTTLNIPGSVTSIGAGAFKEFSGAITVDAGNQNYSALDGVLFSKDKTKLIVCPVSKTGTYVIPNSVNYISGFAFYNCFGLTTVKIPKSVTTIEYYALSGCISLKEIYVYSSIPAVLWSPTFDQVDKNTCVLYVPTSSKNSYAAANYWKDFKNIIEFVVTGLENSAHNNLTNIYPNPNPGKFMLALDSRFTGEIALCVRSSSGATLKTLRFMQTYDQVPQSIDLGVVTPGIYFVEIQGTGFKTVKQIIVK